MKRLIPLLFLFLAGITTYAQCVLIPVSLQKRVYDSDQVVEGRVMKSESFWDSERSLIYTAHTIQVSKVFQENWNTGSDITVLTEGGQIGLTALKVEPSLTLSVGQVGMFFLNVSNITLSNCSNCPSVLYEGVASEQSFMVYDEATMKAHGYFEVVPAIEAELYPRIMGYTGKKYRSVQDVKIGNQGIQPLAAPVITSFSVDTISAGTQSVLTITGSNFGIIRDQGKVEFVDPNYGDGRFFEPAYPSTYKSWSNSKIEIYMPSRSGTGKVRVTNTNNESTTSSDEINVTYAHSNVGYQGTTGIDSGYYMLAHINDNGKGGYTWQFNSKFSKNNSAVNSFLRAAENWRCQTLMNWNLGDDTNTDAIARDNVNVVRFTKFGDNKLGVCYSWYNGCFNSGNVHWYVSELDIEFDSTRNWYYGVGSPGKSQFDFETVATHELGHGHQLGHVIDNTKIMHYSLGAGDRNVTLSAGDLEGGQFVHDRSVTGIPCGPGDFTSINASDCNITRPRADFAINDTVLCPGDDMLLTDATEGNVDTYSWNFGSDASPATSTQKGPHTVSYSSAGTKTIQLITINAFGPDTAIRMVLVEPEAPNAPALFSYDTVQCIGVNDFEIQSVTNATSYTWNVTSGGTIASGQGDTAIAVNWTSATNATVLSVKASNSCGESSTVAAEMEVVDVAVADFTNDNDSLTLNFTNLSTSADEFRWDFGDGDTSVVQNPSHKFPTRAVYTVQLLASNACSDSLIEKEISVDYGVSVPEKILSPTKFYPNPAKDVLHFEFPGHNGSIVLHNQLGQFVMEQSFENHTTLNVQELTAGFYTYTVNSGAEIYHGKIEIRK